jgi:DNA-binding CsgD family transcriptional regulator/outer membrane lipoprotein-sorting protein
MEGMSLRRGRPRYEDILTPREWQVLELVQAGLTNEQIAERLGISFGTAKYHVAEIISKLGVATREEAVVAARRGRAPAVPAWNFAWLRGRGWLPLLGGAAVVAAVLLIAVATLTDILRDSSAPASEGDLSEAAADFQEGDAAANADVLNRAPAELRSYYYELTVTSRDPMVPTSTPRNTTLSVRVWHEAPDRWRVEHLDASAGSPRSVQITDGTIVWYHNVLEATYSRQPAEAGARYGPLFGPITADSIADYMEEQADGPSHYWLDPASEQVAGIDAVTIVQVCCRSGPVDQRISEQRFWIDPVYNFLLRLEEKSLGTGGVVLYEVTDLEYNPDLDDALFRFEPPPGVTETPP